MGTDVRAGIPPVAFLVAGTFFMENLDGTVIATALPHMADTFQVSAVSLNSGITAYLLTLGVFIPVSGWVADRFGARTVFTAAIGLFTAASLLCGLCDSRGPFIALRIVQGIGGAMMVPVGRLAVLRSTPKERLVQAIAAITWPGLVAPLLGPPVGGFLVQYVSWRWIFYLNVPLGLLAMVLAVRLVEDNTPAEPRAFDWPGFLYTGIATLGLMYAVELVALNPVPWAEAALAGVGGGAVAVLAVRHLRRAPAPMLDLSPLRVRTFRVTVAGGSLFRIAIGAVPFLLPLMFQLGFDLDPFQSGLLVLAVTTGTLVMKPVTTPLMRRLGFRRAIVVSSIATAATLLACAALSPGTPAVVAASVLFVCGLARSLQFTAYNTLAFVDVPKAGMGGANTLYSAALQISLGLGVGVGAAAVRGAAWLEQYGLLPHGPDTRFRIAFALIALLAATSVIDGLRLPRDAGEQVLRPGPG